jgi:F-box-like
LPVGLFKYKAQLYPLLINDHAPRDVLAIISNLDRALKNSLIPKRVKTIDRNLPWIMEALSSHRSSPIPNMQVLPTEILLEVFELVSKADLKSLRLASKRFSAIAPSLLFRSVNASHHAKDLEILRLISKHDDFRHHVREIIYFEVYYTIGEVILQPDVYASSIASTLARMPNLRGLVLKNHWLPPREDPSYIYSDEEVENTALYGPRSSRYFPLTEGKPYATPAYRDIGWRGLAVFDYGFEIMCHALAISDVHLHSFSVDYVDEYSHQVPGGLSPSTFSNMLPRELEHTYNAFQHFRSISLSLGCDYKTLSLSSNKELLNPAKMLAAARNLEELKLHFWNRSYEICLEGILGSCIWPHLRSIHLSYSRVDNKELADLVCRHHKTLKSLHLWQIYIKNDNWWTWAESVRPYISSSLEEIEFTPLWYKERNERRQTPETAWIESECCLKNYLLLGSYKRDCCHTSRFRSKHLTDEEVMRTLRQKNIRPPDSGRFPHYHDQLPMLP